MIESLISGILKLLNQAVCTFADVLFRPIRFARSFASGSMESDRYVAPFTFLAITGFLGTKAYLITTTSTFLIYAEYLGGDDTLQNENH